MNADTVMKNVIPVRSERFHHLAGKLVEMVGIETYSKVVMAGILGIYGLIVAVYLVGCK